MKASNISTIISLLLPYLCSALPTPAAITDGRTPVNPDDLPPDNTPASTINGVVDPDPDQITALPDRPSFPIVFTTRPPPDPFTLFPPLFSPTPIIPKSPLFTPPISADLLKDLLRGLGAPKGIELPGLGPFTLPFPRRNADAEPPSPYWPEEIYKTTLVTSPNPSSTSTGSSTLLPWSESNPPRLYTCYYLPTTSSTSGLPATGTWAAQVSSPVPTTLVQIDGGAVEKRVPEWVTGYDPPPMMEGGRIE